MRRGWGSSNNKSPTLRTVTHTTDGLTKDVARRAGGVDVRYRDSIAQVDESLRPLPPPPHVIDGRAPVAIPVPRRDGGRRRTGLRYLHTFIEGKAP